MFCSFVLRKIAFHIAQRGAGNVAARPAPLRRVVPVPKHHRRSSAPSGKGREARAKKPPSHFPVLPPAHPAVRRFRGRGSAGSRGAERTAAFDMFPQNRRLRHEFSRQRFRPEPPDLPAATAPGELPESPGAAGAPGSPEMKAVFVFWEAGEAKGGVWEQRFSEQAVGRVCRRQRLLHSRRSPHPATAEPGLGTRGDSEGRAVFPAALHCGGSGSSGPKTASSRPKSLRRRRQEATGAPTFARPAGPAQRGRGFQRPRLF